MFKIIESDLNFYLDNSNGKIILSISYSIIFILLFVELVINPEFSSIIFILSLILLLFFNAFQILEAISASKIKIENSFASNISENETDIFTAVIFAYLPNEEKIIIETIQHFLNSEIYLQGRLKVILAFNSPIYLPVIEELKRLGKENKNLELFNINKSTRKAININSILPNIKTNIVGFFDADSRPLSNNFDLANRWLKNGFEFVQGSNIIQKGNGLLNFLIRNECKIKYLVAYTGRFRKFNVTYFSGSNAYWKTSVLKNLKANINAHVEDIDMSIRALLNGVKLAYDPSIIAFEQAPTTLKGWFIQRLRWGEGWTQLLSLYYIKILSSTKLSLKQQFLWIYFLTKRFMLPLLFLSITFSVLIKLFFSPIITKFEIMLIVLYYILNVSIEVNSSIKLLKLNRNSRDFFVEFLKYSILYPFYDILVNFTIFWGAIRIFKKNSNWVCTPR